VVSVGIEPFIAIVMSLGIISWFGSYIIYEIMDYFPQRTSRCGLSCAILFALFPIAGLTCVLIAAASQETWQLGTIMGLLAFVTFGLPCIAAISNVQYVHRYIGWVSPEEMRKQKIARLKAMMNSLKRKS
jgi:hypothetical protein